MNTIPQRPVHRMFGRTGLLVLSVLLASPGLAATTGGTATNRSAKTVKVTLSEWKVQLSPDKIPAGPVEFEVSNTGSIPQYGAGAKRMSVAGGGPVIQILPGPFPFADRAAAVIRNRPPDQQADLTHKAQMGPYSNNVASISGNISLVAIDHGAKGDSVAGVAWFTAKDGARWRVVMDRVQTKDIHSTRASAV